VPSVRAEWRVILFNSPLLHYLCEPMVNWRTPAAPDSYCTVSGYEFDALVLSSSLPA
jgi:hypothetical protein